MQTACRITEIGWGWLNDDQAGCRRQVITTRSAGVSLQKLILLLFSTMLLRPKLSVPEEIRIHSHGELLPT